MKSYYFAYVDVSSINFTAVLMFAVLIAIIGVVIYAAVKGTQEGKEIRERAETEKNEFQTKKRFHIKETHIIGQSSQKNTDSAIGRAVVGGVVAGGAGAVVGASTGKNDEIITFLVIYDDDHRETDRVKYGDEKYNVYIQFLKV